MRVMRVSGLRHRRDYDLGVGGTLRPRGFRCNCRGAKLSGFRV